MAQAVVSGHITVKPPPAKPPVKPRVVKPPPRKKDDSDSSINTKTTKNSVPPPQKRAVMDNGEIAPPETPLGMPPMKPPPRHHSPSYHTKRPPQIKARGTLMPSELDATAEEGKNLLNSAMSV